MKPFRITVYLGATEIDPPDLDAEGVEDWLEDRFQHITSMFEGYGSVHIDPREDGLVDVNVAFSVRGESPLDVIDKFRSDFEVVKSLSRGIQVTEAATFQLCLFRVEGEHLAAFIRHHPTTGRPMYSDGEAVR